MIFYVDGSCVNDGSTSAAGGFGVVGIIDDVGIYYYSEGCLSSTNNREELKAILHVIRKFGDCNPVVYSDSAYCVNIYTKWMFNWERNGWVTMTDKKTPDNLDIIQEFYDLYDKGYTVNLQKIKGHDGHYWNELVDQMAKSARMKQRIREIDLRKEDMNE